MNGHRLVQRGAALCLALFASIVLTMLTATPALADWGYEESDEARNISVNTTYSATTLEYNDEDWYVFRTTSAGVVQFTFTNEQRSSGYWNVGLYTSSADSTFVNYEFEATAKSHTSTKVGLPAGTYFIRVNPGGYYDYGIPYTLRVNFTKTSTWETEPNGQFEIADSISVGKAVNATSKGYDDPDWFKFSISKPGVIQLAFTNSQHSSGSWDVTITNSDIDEIDSYEFVASTASHAGSKIGVPAGTYYVKVDPTGYGDYGYQYSLKMNYTASSVWETEYNDRFENADTLTVGKTTYASSMDYNDVDWYKFTLTKSTKVQLSFSNDQHSSGSWDVTLADSDTNKIDSYEFEATKKTHSSPAMTLPAGTYYVKVEPTGYGDYGYNYNLRVAQPSQTRTMYRLYNRYTGEHFYTASATERDSLRRSGWTTSVSEYNALGRLGWRKEGVGWRSGGSVKVYRQYNKYATTGTHNYTTSKAENDELVRLGWKAEGVGWYAVRAK